MALEISTTNLADLLKIALKDELAKEIEMKLKEVAFDVVVQLTKEIVRNMSVNVQSWSHIYSKDITLMLNIDGVPAKIGGEK